MLNYLSAMSSANVFSLRMSLYSALKFQVNQDSTESSLMMLHTGISRRCTTISIFSGRSRESFTRFRWLQSSLPTYNLPTLTCIAYLLAQVCHLEEIWEHIQIFKSFHRSVPSVIWHTSNQELGLHHAAGQWYVMSLWRAGICFLRISLRLSPTAEEGFWTWSWILSGLRWELKHTTISQQGCCYLVIS